MKIIVSPAKTFANNYKIDDKFNKNRLSKPIFLDDANYIISYLKGIDVNKISSVYGVSQKKSSEVVEYIKQFGDAELPAIYYYNGIVFKQLSLDKYDNEQLNYLSNNLFILSAMYGVLAPFDFISRYRLDFKISISINLYEFWKDKLSKFFSDIYNNNKNEIFINLTSNEYFKMLPRDIQRYFITIKFYSKKGDKLKNIATYSKIMRGKFLDYMINNGINNLSELIKISIDDYKYDSDLSNNRELIFVKNS